MSKKPIFLFTDASVNPQSKEGFGACLHVENLQLNCEDLRQKVQLKKFVNTSSTKLELETLLWALDEKALKNYKILIYTDCQNIIGLQERRAGFESKNYMTSKNKQISNHELYKAFFEKTDNLDCEFIKVKGHKKSSQKEKIDKIFMIVDKASRDALKKEKKNQSLMRDEI